jgi:hypothetical protein
MANCKSQSMLCDVKSPKNKVMRTYRDEEGEKRDVSSQRQNLLLLLHRQA